jgi:hypothetical protein
MLCVNRPMGAVPEHPSFEPPLERLAKELGIAYDRAWCATTEGCGCKRPSRGQMDRGRQTRDAGVRCRDSCGTKSDVKVRRPRQVRGQVSRSDIRRGTPARSRDASFHGVGAVLWRPRPDVSARHLASHLAPIIGAQWIRARRTRAAAAGAAVQGNQRSLMLCRCRAV